jgi:hypothetical protein
MKTQTERKDKIKQEVAMNKVKSTNHSLLLREMAAKGIPLDLPVVQLDVEIEQVGGVTENMIFDLTDGRCGWIIQLLIINQPSRPIQFRDVALRPTWQNSDFEWLRDPEEIGRDPFNYHLPGKGAQEFPRAQVLNHVVSNYGILKPECPMQGWLLGVGNPKPANLMLGALIEVELAIIAYDHSEYEERISLWVDPVMKHQQGSSRRISREGLYASERSPSPVSPNFDKAGKVPGGESAPVKKINQNS